MAVRDDASMNLFLSIQSKYSDKQRRLYDDLDYDRISRARYNSELKELAKQKEQELKNYGFKKRNGNWVYGGSSKRSAGKKPMRSSVRSASIVAKGQSFT